MSRIEFLEMGLIGKRKVLLGRRCMYLYYICGSMGMGRGKGILLDQ